MDKITDNRIDAAIGWLIVSLLAWMFTAFVAAFGAHIVWTTQTNQFEQDAARREATRSACFAGNEKACRLYEVDYGD